MEGIGQAAIRLQGWDAMRVLITGVSGQLGYYLAQGCEKAGAEVFDIVQPQAGVHLIGGTEKELPFVHVVDGDQCDVRSLLRIKEEVKPDVVFALGALSVPAYASYLSAVTKFPRASTATGPFVDRRYPIQDPKAVMLSGPT